MSRFKLSMASLALVLAMASQAFAGPTISSISPTSILAGTQSFTLTVNGANFTSPAVLWNNTPLPLTYVSSTMLRVSVANTFLTAPDTVQIAVIVAGVRSNIVTFTILSSTSPPPPTTTTTTTSPLAITTTSIPIGTAGAPYSATLAASGGTVPYNWSVSSGALPPGLTHSTAGRNPRLR